MKHRSGAASTIDDSRDPVPVLLCLYLWVGPRKRGEIFERAHTGDTGSGVSSGSGQWQYSHDCKYASLHSCLCAQAF